MPIKRYLICSDSHGNGGALLKLLPYLDQMDGVIHLGDHIEDLDVLRQARPDLASDFFIGVRGNCDGNGSGKNEQILIVGSHRILLTHGHRHDVKTGLLRIFHYALEKEVNCVLFGHTHQPFLVEESGVCLHNPGSISLPKGGSRSSFSLMELTETDMKITIKDI